MSLRDVAINPAFNINEPVKLVVNQIYTNNRDASAASLAWLRSNPWPELNKTMRWNRRTNVRCCETGQIFRNQRECATMLGLNQAQLSQHLRRNPGYKTIKGMTYENIPDTQQAVKYPHE
jgi:hypothetical protein